MKRLRKIKTSKIAKVKLLFLLCFTSNLLAPSVLAQNPTSGGPIPASTYTTPPVNANPTHGTGAPSGACISGVLYTNDSNGNVYGCNGGTWTLAGGNITGQTNVYGAFLQDFSAATIKIPQAAGFTATANSTFGIDTTNQILHAWLTSFDRGVFVGPAGGIGSAVIPRQLTGFPNIFAASLLTDNGTTLAYTGTGGASAPILTSSVATGTSPIVVTSTTTVPNLTASNHPKIQFCGTTSTCSATAEVSDQIVYGSAALVSGTPSTVTITGISPAFTSTTSYRCTATDDTTATNDLLLITAVSGSSFTITGPATTTDIVGYVCVGH